MTPMTETLQHSNIVTDTESVLDSFFVYINENSFKKLSATFGQFLSTVLKRFAIFLDILPLDVSIMWNCFLVLGRDILVRCHF